MAGGLDDETPSTTDPMAMDHSAGVDDKEVVRDDNQQKIELLRALLEIGALSEALFILSEFSFLLNSHSFLAEAFNSLLEHIVQPLWDGIRPQKQYPHSASASLKQAKRIPEDLKFRESALILPPAPKIQYVIHPVIPSKRDAVEMHFFYDEVSSHLKVCTNTEVFDARVLPYLRIAGVQIFRSVVLCTKIAKIGKLALSVSKDPEAVRKTWSSILRSNLLPALALLEANPAIVSDVYSLLTQFGADDRYSLYGEWFVDSYKRVPELKVQFVKTEKETKSLLRRISKTNTKEYGRRLAKVSHSNPCIVLNIALNQIESYDNLVDVVIEASRYFTLLTFDVLVYIMLTLLSNNQKRRLKEDGTSVAHWLQSLSSFTAKIFKRYSHMDASPICVYVAKQLKLNNAFDLIILRDLITEMAGLQPNSDLSEEQLQGCSGGPCLRVEALSLINERRDPLAKAPGRLLHAFDRTSLTYSLPILIGQQRTQCVYNVPEEQSLLKLLGNLADEVSQILLQYLEFLVLNTDIESYTKSIPSIMSMVQDSSLEPVVAFMFARPALQNRIQNLNVEETRNRSTSHANGQDAVMAEVDDDVKNESIPIPMDVDSDSASANSALLNFFSEIASEVQSIHSPQIWSYLSPELYAVFWSLSLYDLTVPSARYEKEIGLIKQQISDLTNVKGDLTTTENRSKPSEVRRLESLLADLSSEHALQCQNHAAIKRFVQSRKTQWFNRSEMTASDSTTTEWHKHSATSLVQHCLLPRCLSSPNDATYSAHLLALFHESAMPHLNIMRVYGTLFGPHLATTIFTCTEREAENLGRFLNEVLKRLNLLNEVDSVYQAAPVRSKLSGETGDLDSGDFMPWERFKDLWYKGFRPIWINVKACFESKEYMHIRNVLIVLERMHGSFPYFKWIGKNIEKEVDLIISTERREDLKIRALGYKAVLKKQQDRWQDPPKAAGNDEQAAATEQTATTEKPTKEEADVVPVIKKAEAEEEQQQPATLNPQVPEFEPKIAPTVKANTAGVSPSLQTSEAQREVAKQKAMALGAELRAKQISAKLAQEERGASVPNPATIVPGAAKLSTTKTEPTSSSRDQNKTNSSDRPRTTPSGRSSRPVSPGSDRHKDRSAPSAESREYRNNSEKPSAPRQSTNAQTSVGRNSDERSRDSPSERSRPSTVEDERSNRPPPRQMRAPHPMTESTAGRLSDPNYKLNGSSRSTSRSVNPDNRSNGRDVHGQQASHTQTSREDATRGNVADAPRARMESEVSTSNRSSRLDVDRSRDLDSSRTVPEGPRSLGSRISSSDTPQRDPPRNAPEGPRQPKSPPRGRGSRGLASNASQRSPPSGDQFVHPDRRPATQTSPPAASAPSRPPPSRVESRQTRQTPPAAIDPPIHPSRRDTIARSQPSSDDRPPDNFRPPRTTHAADRSLSSSNYENSTSRQADTHHREEPPSSGRTDVSRLSGREGRALRSRESDTRETRSSSYRGTRDSPRTDPRQSESSDLRDGRERSEGRRERIVDRRDEVDGKRRHASDSRESLRPTKQRRH